MQAGPLSISTGSDSPLSKPTIGDFTKVTDPLRERAIIEAIAEASSKNEGIEAAIHRYMMRFNQFEDHLTTDQHAERDAKFTNPTEQDASAKKRVSMAVELRLEQAEDDKKFNDEDQTGSTGRDNVTGIRKESDGRVTTPKPTVAAGKAMVAELTKNNPKSRKTYHIGSRGINPKDDQLHSKIARKFGSRDYYSKVSEGILLQTMALNGKAPNFVPTSAGNQKDLNRMMRKTKIRLDGQGVRITQKDARDVLKLRDTVRERIEHEIAERATTGPTQGAGAGAGAGSGGGDAPSAGSIINEPHVNMETYKALEVPNLPDGASKKEIKAHAKAKQLAQNKQGLIIAAVNNKDLLKMSQHKPTGPEAHVEEQMQKQAIQEIDYRLGIGDFEKSSGWKKLSTVTIVKRFRKPFSTKGRTVKLNDDGEFIPDPKANVQDRNGTQTEVGLRGLSMAKTIRQFIRTSNNPDAVFENMERLYAAATPEPRTLYTRDSTHDRDHQAMGKFQQRMMADLEANPNLSDEHKQQVKTKLQTAKPDSTSSLNRFLARAEVASRRDSASVPRAGWTDPARPIASATPTDEDLGEDPEKRPSGP